MHRALRDLLAVDFDDQHDSSSTEATERALGQPNGGRARGAERLGQADAVRPTAGAYHDMASDRAVNRGRALHRELRRRGARLEL